MVILQLSGALKLFYKEISHMVQVIGVLRRAASQSRGQQRHEPMYFGGLVLHVSPNLVLHSQRFRVFPNVSLFLIRTEQSPHARTG